MVSLAGGCCSLARMSSSACSLEESVEKEFVPSCVRMDVVKILYSEGKLYMT